MIDFANLDSLYPGGLALEILHPSANPHGGPTLLRDNTPPPPNQTFLPAPDHGHSMSPGAGDLLPDTPKRAWWKR